MKKKDDRPSWLQALEAACKASSQTAVAKRLTVSNATVCAVLKGTYHADTTRIEARVRGALMAETVVCPLLGELPKDQCVEEQGMGFHLNPHRAALYVACKTCPNAIPKERP